MCFDSSKLYVPVATSENCPVCDKPMFINKEDKLECYCGYIDFELSELLELTDTK